MGILSVLWGIVLPAMAGVRERARMAKCTANLRQLYIALEAYHDDWCGRYWAIYDWHRPPGGWQEYLVAPYRQYYKDERILKCPSEKSGLAGPFGSYWYAGVYLGNPPRWDPQVGPASAAYACLEYEPAHCPLLDCYNHTHWDRAATPKQNLRPRLHLGVFGDGHVEGRWLSWRYVEDLGQWRLDDEWTNCVPHPF